MNTEVFHLDTNGDPLLDEEGDPIPISICLCFAHSASECICGAWKDVEGWDD